MLVANSTGLNFNFGESNTTTRRLDINYSGGAFVSLDREEESGNFNYNIIKSQSAANTYLEGFQLEDINSIEDTIIVDFFDTLQTPVEETKPFFSKEVNMNQHHYQASLNQRNNNLRLNSNLNLASSESYMELSKFVDGKGMEVDEHRNAIDGTLMTPIVDPDGGMDPNQNPFIPLKQNLHHQTSVNSPYVCGPPDDICGSFTVPENKASTFAVLPHQQQPIHPAFTHQPQHLQQEPVNSMLTGGYNEYSTPTYSSSSMTTMNSDLITTSSNSVTYTELKSRSTSSPPDLPTVINDHPYNRGAMSSAAPSPAPSTSSITSSSTADNKDWVRSIFDTDSDVKANFVGRKRNTDLGKKSRMTKKQKLDEMIRQQHQLEQQNQDYKKQVSDLEWKTKSLRDYLMKIIAKK